ncbi:unnamed protein product [Closterium sp. Naga37s-1]|nr:unnamed protein product [Closterium sp. Naga37s-1]
MWLGSSLIPPVPLRPHPSSQVEAVTPLPQSAAHDIPPCAVAVGGTDVPSHMPHMPSHVPNPPPHMPHSLGDTLQPCSQCSSTPQTFETSQKLSNPPSHVPHSPGYTLQPCSQRSSSTPHALAAGMEAAGKVPLDPVQAAGQVQVVITRAADELLAVKLVPYNEAVKDVCKSISGRFWDKVSRQWKYPFHMADEVVAALACITDVPIQDLVAPMKSVPCSIWQQDKRLWVFPLSSLDAFLEAVQSVPTCDVEVEPLPPAVQRALEETAKLPDDSGRYFDLPDGFRKLLMPFQEQGMQFALSRGGRVLIADEMGLGKTVQAIGLAACYRDEWPVLVIAPSSLRLHWAMSIVRWLDLPPEDITVVMPQGTTRSINGFNFVRCTRNQPLSLQSPFNIISYDLLDRLEQPEEPFKVVIADESHYLKNYKAKRTGLAVPRLQRANRAILLTGTPALSRPIDLFKQLEALQPHAYRKLGEYGKRYCRGGRFGEFTGSSNLEELHAVLSGTVMIRRLKKQVLPQLPDKRRQQVLLMLEEKAMKPIRALHIQLRKVREKKKAAATPEKESEAVMEERALVSRLYTESAWAKVDAVREYLGTMLEGGCKFLVFAHHMTMMDALSEFFQKAKVGYIRIDGGTAPEKRHHLVARFQEEPDTRVAVLGIHAAGVGLTLTAASTVVFAEMAWNPGDLVQAEDRAHRIGQANAVNVYYLHAPETIDDVIWSVVQHKLENLGQVMDGEQKQSLQVHKDPRHAASAAALAVRKKGGGDEQQGEQGSGKWGGLTHAGVTDGGVTVAGCGGGEEKKRQRTINEMFQPPR